MPLKGGLISYLACLMYVPYLWKLYKLENHEVSLQLHIYSMLG